MFQIGEAFSNRENPPTSMTFEGFLQHLLGDTPQVGGYQREGAPNPEPQHGTWTWTPAKEESYKKSFFLGSMLVLLGVDHWIKMIRTNHVVWDKQSAADFCLAVQGVVCFFCFLSCSWWRYWNLGDGFNHLLFLPQMFGKYCGTNDPIRRTHCSNGFKLTIGFWIICCYHRFCAPFVKQHLASYIFVPLQDAPSTPQSKWRDGLSHQDGWKSQLPSSPCRLTQWPSIKLFGLHLWSREIY